MYKEAQRGLTLVLKFIVNTKPNVAPVTHTSLSHHHSSFTPIEIDREGGGGHIKKGTLEEKKEKRIY